MTQNQELNDIIDKARELLKRAEDIANTEGIDFVLVDGKECGRIQYVSPQSYKKYEGTEDSIEEMLQKGPDYYPGDKWSPGWGWKSSSEYTC